MGAVAVQVVDRCRADGDHQPGGRPGHPTNASPINFTVVFSESVTGFATGDVTLSGTAGATRPRAVTGSGTTYNVAVSGMTADGTVIATIAAGVAHDAAGQRQHRVDQHRQHGHLRHDRADGDDQPGGGQADPTNASPINFTVVFSESVTGFATGDVTCSGTAGATTGHRDRQRDDLQRRGQRHDQQRHRDRHDRGRRARTMRRATATPPRPAPTTPSPTTPRAPTVTINQAAGQADPTNASPINFTVVFSEPVTGFAPATSR